MEVGRDDDAQPGAGVDVDVGIDAALADEPEAGQALQQGGVDGRALADEDQRLGVRQPSGQGVDVLDVVVPHRDVVAVEHPEAVQRPEGVEVVVEDRHSHGHASCGTGPRGGTPVVGPGPT